MIEPYDHGMLDVGDGHHVYWETCGNQSGIPALFVHGGPGSGCSPKMRGAFPPDRFRGILFDQRGCGRSTPPACGDVDMSVNTTWHLVADMERLREHLGVEKWLLYGGSWGCTLILAYAEKYPSRVSGIVMSAITSGRRSESDWLYRGAARFFPEEYERFRSLVPSGDVIAGYAALMGSPSREVRIQAAREWARWEDVVVSLEPGARPNMYSGDRDDDDLLTFARITAHYNANGAWLEEGQLIREAHRLAGVPGVLVHGRQDLSCPFDTAWELARAWPDATLVPLRDTGHQATDERRAATRAALEKISAEVSIRP